MANRFVFIALTLLSLMGSGQSLAVTYQTPLDESVWQVESSVFLCKMWHSIPFYGTGEFSKRAGEPSTFKLLPDMGRFETGKALLKSEAPVWKPQGRDLNLGYVPVNRGKHPVQLDEVKAERLLAELLAGQKIVFTRAPWYGAEESSRVALSSINFTAAYRQYMGCLASLLPVNFDQIRRNSIYFYSNDEKLRPSEQLKIDHIGIYVKADPTVKAFYIDGHTDGVGMRNDNLELSRQRAESVAEMLKERGIPASQIVVRWHGERYPVASNQSRVGRAQNRRVTIRLEREPTQQETTQTSMQQARAEAISPE